MPDIPGTSLTVIDLKTYQLLRHEVALRASGCTIIKFSYKTGGAKVWKK
jgi:hypothetical protein